MDWTLLGIILAPIFFIATIVLATRLAKKKKPAWAHVTTKVIGLGSDAPPELKMTFAGKDVTGVYRTIFIFFNKGNETIPQAHVTETIAVHFEGADILRDPTILVASKEANKISVRKSTENGDNVIVLQFLYLDHDDGVVVDVLHTKSQHIRCSGNMMGTDRIEDMGEFVAPTSQRRSPRLARFIALGIMLLAVITLAVLRYKAAIVGSVGDYAIAALLGLLLGMLAGGRRTIREDVQSARFPIWSMLPK